MSETMIEVRRLPDGGFECTPGFRVVAEDGAIMAIECGRRFAPAHGSGGGRAVSDWRGNPEFNPGWDVLRDSDGNPVTLTWEQVHAVWHAISVVEAVRLSEGHRSLWDSTGGADLAKSRLLGRMLTRGLPPTRTRPPLETAGPAWWALPGGDPFDSPEDGQ